MKFSEEENKKLLAAIASAQSAEEKTAATNAMIDAAAALGVELDGPLGELIAAAKSRIVSEAARVDAQAKVLADIEQRQMAPVVQAMTTTIFGGPTLGAMLTGAASPMKGRAPLSLREISDCKELGCRPEWYARMRHDVDAARALERQSTGAAAPMPAPLAPVVMTDDQQAAERPERNELVARLIVAGWETPGSGFEKDANGMVPKGPFDRRVAEPYASMPLAQLRAIVAEYTNKPRAGVSFKSGMVGVGNGADAGFLSEQELRDCAELKCPPERYLELKNKRAAHAAEGGAR